MEGRLLLKNARVLISGKHVQNASSLVVDNGVLLEMGPVDSLPTLPGDWEVPCRERLLTHGRCVDFSTFFLPFEALNLPGNSRDVRRFALASALKSGIIGFSGLPADWETEAASLGFVGSMVEATELKLHQPANWVLWDFVPPPGLFDFHAALPVLRAAWVVSQGRVVVREGQLLTADFLTLSSAASKGSEP